MQSRQPSCADLSSEIRGGAEGSQATVPASAFPIKTPARQRYHSGTIVPFQTASFPAWERANRKGRQILVPWPAPPIWCSTVETLSRSRSHGNIPCIVSLACLSSCPPRGIATHRNSTVLCAAGTSIRACHPHAGAQRVNWRWHPKRAATHHPGGGLRAHRLGPRHRIHSG